MGQLAHKFPLQGAMLLRPGGALGLLKMERAGGVGGGDEAVGWKSLSPSFLRVDNYFPAQGQLVPFSYPYQQRTVNLEQEEQGDEGEQQLQIGNSPSSGQWDSWE